MWPKEKLGWHSTAYSTVSLILILFWQPNSHSYSLFPKESDHLTPKQAKVGSAGHSAIRGQGHPVLILTIKTEFCSQLLHCTVRCALILTRVEDKDTIYNICSRHQTASATQVTQVTPLQLLSTNMIPIVAWFLFICLFVWKSTNNKRNRGRMLNLSRNVDTALLRIS